MFEDGGKICEVLIPFEDGGRGYEGPYLKMKKIGKNFVLKWGREPKTYRERTALKLKKKMWRILIESNKNCKWSFKYFSS